MELLTANTEIVKQEEHSVVCLVILHTTALEAHYAFVACMN